MQPAPVRQTFQGTNMHTCAADQSEKNVHKFCPIFGPDGPYLALLGPLLASPASGLTPSTCGNPVSTRPKQIFDEQYFREFSKIVFWLFTPSIGLVWPRNHHRKIRLEIPYPMMRMPSLYDFGVRFYVHFCVQFPRFILVCSTSLQIETITTATA